MGIRRVLIVGTVLATTAASGAQTQPEPTMPRFRAGANLVRVDAYVSLEGQTVHDLTADDFEIFEDDRPQKVEQFEYVRARGEGGVAASSAPSPVSTREMLDAARDPEARVFVIYLDVWHVGLDGSVRSPEPIARMLEKVIGPNDLVGIMTPEMTPQNMTLVRRGQGLDTLLRDSWTWGERDKLLTSDPREADIRGCYPGPREAIAKEMIERRREQKTLRSLDGTVRYLDTVRDERKFVVLLSEGWILFRRNDDLAGPIDGRVPDGLPPVGVVGGRLSAQGDQSNPGSSTLEWCDRERVMLAYIDHELEVRQLAQRANRANVSFYTVDPRGLTAFDDSIGGLRPAGPVADGERMRARQNGLRELAEQTDGGWVLNTNDTAGALERLLADTGSYYLLSYYSTNSKLDGRFRRISVRVKREGTEVRARPGYLAPTEAEARAAGGGVDAAPTPGSRPSPPPAVSRALEAIVPGRGNLPVRVQATGLQDRVRIVVELDPTTLKQTEWQAGATLQITIDGERGGRPRVVSAELNAGQRSVVVEGPDEPIDPGRYFVRIEGRPSSGNATIRASTTAGVAAESATVGSAALAFRRGPTTGLAYQPTADPRFRRTERLRAEVPVFGTATLATSGRVLTREGQPLPLVVVMSERTDAESGQRYVVADATLAPLAQGDYVLELIAGKDSIGYGFRIVP
jgi:VWFA-related protein